MGLYEVVQSERKEMYFLGKRDIVTNKFTIEKVFFDERKANRALLVKKGVHVKERHSVFRNSN